VDQWEKTRRIILARDCGKCLRCLGEACDVHHRKPKGMGGASAETEFGLANLVSLCRDCHSFCHLEPSLAYKTGFLVHSWEDPAEIPLKVGSYSHVIRLDSAGNLEEVGGVLQF
jgi:5-methylcytosine-specific restriction protein A